jgi:2-oxoglutarate ferredoxin oxidoreductase subunit alpha
MTEKVVIPAADQIEVVPRRHTHKSADEYLPYATNGDGVPEMAHAGEGYRFHVTGLTHDERGYPNMTPQTQDKLVRRLQSKILDAAERITLLEEEQLEGADVIVISYGITSRVAQRAIEMAREQGLRVGKLRLITCWPFPEKRIRELAAKAPWFRTIWDRWCGGARRGWQSQTILVPHARQRASSEDILKAIVGPADEHPRCHEPRSALPAQIACRISGVPEGIGIDRQLLRGLIE